ncbi:TPA: hypothetical protein ACPJ1H_003912 [Vibrio alginolyticus]|nr:hypothetical protein CGI45_18390 [Vibrio parahaemolyticus]HCG5484187.1 hypothetical protein [Vibrio parahaemolyticus]
MKIFPPSGVKEDSSKFSLKLEDKGLSSETESAYVYSRPRHGRRPRRIVATGFTDINQNDKVKLEQFVNEHGTYLIFSYTIPDTGETIAARFTNLPEFPYSGVGGNHRYNVTDIELTEV